MREILFRGKRVNNGEWVFGYYCRAFRWTGDKNPVASIQELDCFYFREVDEKTVGQYTGLTDKNGKKIFEGDIISINFDGFPVYKREVSFNQDVSAYVLWDGTKSRFYPMTEAPEKYCEVIGTIHDNPELLEVGE